MNETEYFNFIFRGTAEFGDVQQELAELLVINEKLKNQNLEYQSLQRKLAAEKKNAVAEEKAAAIAELNSRLGIQNGVKTEIGLIQRLTSEIKLLKSAREQANNVSDVNKYTGAIQSAQKELNTLTGVTDKFRGSNGFWQDLKGQVMAYWAAVQVGDVGKTLINNEVRLEAIRLALRNVLATQEEYTQSLAFLDNVSNKYGQDITILTETYKNFIAASKSSGLELKERNRIYEAIVKSGAALSLSNEEIEGSLRAVSQMFSKGNVQAEELRGQLGERLPGAFGLAAKALGVTESKLNDMLKAGQVLAVDLLPKLATELEKAFGDKAANNVNLVTGAYNRLTNSIKDYFGEANQTYGITDKIAKGFNFLADNLKAVVGIVATVVETIIAYTIASKAAGVASAAWAAVEKIALIIKGEAALANYALTGATFAQMRATIAATTAARAFNATLIVNPFTAIAVAIGTMVAAYQLYNASVEDAAEEQNKLNKQITDAIAPLELQKREFNNLANEVLKGVVPLQKQYDTLEALKKQYPELLKGVTSLTEAERILNENKIKVNTQDDYRLEKLEALKAQYPEQLKGINNLKDAEEKLGKVIRDVNADFAVRATLLEAEIKYDINREKATNLIKQQIDAEGKLVNIRKQLSIETKNSLEGREEFISALREEEKQYQGVINAAKAGVVNLIGVNQSITKIQEDAKKRLKYNTDEVVKITKDGEDKKTKIKADSAATQALIAEKTRITELEKSEVQEQKLLAIDKDIAIQRIKDSTKKAQEKASEIYKIEEKFRQDLNKLTQKYDAIEDKENEKLAKERLEFRKGTDKALNQSEEERRLANLKANKKYLDDGIKQDEKNAKEQIKLQEDKYELVSKLRLLDRISHAKTAEEIVKIEKEEVQKRLEENVEYYRNLKTLAELKLARAKMEYGEDSLEYKTQKGVTLQAEQDFTVAWEKLVEGRTEKTKEEVAKQEKAVRDSLQIVNEVANQIFGLFEKQIQKESDATTDLVKKARAENAKQFIEIEKGLLSAVGSLASGDIVGAVTKGVGVLFNAIDYAINERQRIAEAKLAKETAKLQAYIDKTKEQVDGILSTFDRISEVYGTKMEMPDLGSASIEKSIEAEIKLGEQIVKNYNSAVQKENEYYGKVVDGINSAEALKKQKEDDYHTLRIKNITDTYDAEIRRINEKYDLINQKAEQQYNAETLAITTAGSTQLEALIKNEESLASVRSEFAEKRKFINETFALANKQLTADSTQAEIDAVNAAIQARDSALAELQSQYNDELAIIIKNEGQKRTEYTATEKIQNEITDRLDKAALVFQASEILRAQDKATEIAKAEETKNGLLLVEATRYETELTAIKNTAIAERELAETNHNVILKDLAIEKDKAIAESFVRLTGLIINQIGLIQIAMNNAINSNIDEYTKLQEIQKGVLELYRALTGEQAPIVYPKREGTGTDTTPPTTTPRIPRRAIGVDRLPRLSGKAGVDTELTYLDAGERVMPTYLNDMLKSRLGVDVTNKQLVNMALGQFDFAGIANTGKNTSSTDPRLVNAINGLSKEMKNLKQVNVNVKNGVPTIEERSSNRMIKYTKP